MTEQHREAARTLLALNPHDRLALIKLMENAAIADVENSKPHAMRAHKLAEKDWEAFCAHMSDGGGVNDRHELGLSILQRLFDRNQDETFWGDLMHYVKACLRTEGHARAEQEGAILNGVGSPVVQHEERKA